MLLFITFLLIHFLVDPTTAYLAWHDWVLSRGVSIAACVFSLALLAHAWVGVRDVVMDYVHPIAVRVLVLAFVSIGLRGLAHGQSGSYGWGRSDEILEMGVRYRFGKRREMPLKFSIFRFNPERDKKPYMQDYEIELEATERMLLDVILRIKALG